MQFLTYTTRQNRKKIEEQKRRSRRRLLWVVGLVLVAGFVMRNSRSNSTSVSTVTDQTESRSLSNVQKVEAKEPIYRVGIQAGHWKTDEVPTELNKLYWSSGASAGGFNEWEINLEIAQKVAQILRSDEVAVDVLPVTIPEGYKADAFIALHADGNEDTTVSGYKIVGSEWDESGNALKLSQYLDAVYGTKTRLVTDSAYAVSEDMTQYYAFNYRKYHHAIDPSTPGVMVEMGYLTNAADRKILTKSADTLANAIAEGTSEYLRSLGKIK